MKTVSVVVPVYNHADYLAEALYSVWRDAMPGDELIVIDDCSRDGSLELSNGIVEQTWFHERFARVICERNAENIGAANTINRGIAMTSGDYVALLNSDDIFSAGRRAAMVDALQRPGARYAFGKVACVDSMSNRVVSRLGSTIERLQDNLTDTPILSVAFLAGNPAVSTGNLMFERSLFDQIGGFRDLLYCHDWDWCLRAALICEPVFAEDAEYLYRTHNSNSFSDLADFASIDTRACLQTFAQALVRLDIPNLQLLSALQLGLVESFMKRLSPTAYSEWLDCTAGIERPVYEFYAEARDQRAMKARRARKDSAPREIAAPALQVSDGLLVLNSADSLYHDGWLRPKGSIRVASVRPLQTMALTFFIPNELDTRNVSIDVGGRRTTARIVPGKPFVVNVPVGLTEASAEILIDYEFDETSNPSVTDVREVGAVFLGLARTS